MTSPSRRLLAGAVVAVLAAITALLVEGVLGSAANGVPLDGDTLTDHLASTGRQQCHT
ncbi:hypothetical protein [Actinopolyspora mortivallis]|uniref:hypothetical protein n=1 Tax=Actinopolyspora mortivallis TaxID=33906 RepID=UPI0012ECD8E8|nr:hypothetical protein [Actinopolyspora mortivallis]